MSSHHHARFEGQTNLSLFYVLLFCFVSFFCNIYEFGKLSSIFLWSKKEEYRLLLHTYFQWLPIASSVLSDLHTFPMWRWAEILESCNGRHWKWWSAQIVFYIYLNLQSINKSLLSGHLFLYTLFFLHFLYPF